MAAAEWNPFDAPVAATPDGGWPSDEDDDDETVDSGSIARERLDSCMDEPKTGTDFTSPTTHPFTTEDNEVPREAMTRERALARIAELEARNKFLLESGQERLNLKHERKEQVRRKSHMLVRTDLHEIIEDSLAVLPQATDVLEHWTSEGAVVPDHGHMFADDEEEVITRAPIAQRLDSVDLVAAPRMSLGTIEPEKTE